MPKTARQLDREIELAQQRAAFVEIAATAAGRVLAGQQAPTKDLLARAESDAFSAVLGARGPVFGAGSPEVTQKLIAFAREGVEHAKKLTQFEQERRKEHDERMVGISSFFAPLQKRFPSGNVPWSVVGKILKERGYPVPLTGNDKEDAKRYGVRQGKPATINRLARFLGVL